MITALGIDFGTTNSALAIQRDHDEIELIRFPQGGRALPTWRSVLFFDAERRDERERLLPVAGPAAIDGFLGRENPGRLIQSAKAYLASDFRGTRVFGQRFSLEQLIAEMVTQLLDQGGIEVGALDCPIVVGRPVRFTREVDDAAEKLAVGRLKRALGETGLPDARLRLLYEPVAAAWHYSRRVERGQADAGVVLIADFGGGTSDFSLVRVEGGEPRILGCDGVPIAGDALDARIVRELVTPHLGRGTSFRSLFDRQIKVPAWIYRHLARWHHLSFLREQRTVTLLENMQRQADNPEPLTRLLHLVDEDLGYQLFRAVEGLKRSLSDAEVAEFRFQDGPIDLELSLERSVFESWIEGELDALAGCVDRLLGDCGVDRSEVVAVFLTGGTSQVPAVRGLFEQRFGAERLHSGGELTSVVSGLAEAAALAQG